MELLTPEEVKNLCGSGVEDYIAKLTNAAMALLGEAEFVADLHDTEFSFDVAYGMGGNYYSEGYVEKEGGSWITPGWQSSTAACS